MAKFTRRPSYSKSVAPVVASEPTSLMPGTSEQEAIWNALTNSRNHVFVSAKAGTGKTFTIIQGVMRYMKVNPTHRVLMAAFNLSIANELQRKLPANIPSRTTHGWGCDLIKQQVGKLNCKEDWKVPHIIEALNGETPWAVKFSIGKLVNLCMGKLIDVHTFTQSQVEEAIVDIQTEHAIRMKSSDIQLATSLFLEVFKRGLEQASQGIISYTDMLTYPYYGKLIGPHIPYDDRPLDLMIVDEAQDLNAAQHYLAVYSAKRLCVVGDPFQAIYGFRGADSESMNNLELRLHDDCSNWLIVDHYSLTETRRCPKRHVELACSILPSEEKFTALPDAPDGNFKIIQSEDLGTTAKVGDMIICRVNAPLISTAYQLIRANIPVKIQGRKDFASGLKTYIKGLFSNNVRELLIKSESFTDQEISKLSLSKYPQDAKIQTIKDRHECIVCLCEGKQTIPDVVTQIETLFADVDPGTGEEREMVLLSTIHRAKGLEADNVFVLSPDKLPLPIRDPKPWEVEQERNMIYVLMTRSKNWLTFVGGVPTICQSVVYQYSEPLPTFYDQDFLNENESKTESETSTAQIEGNVKSDSEPTEVNAYPKIETNADDLGRGTIPLSERTGGKMPMRANTKKLPVKVPLQSVRQRKEGATEEVVRKEPGRSLPKKQTKVPKTKKGTSKGK